MSDYIDKRQLFEKMEWDNDIEKWAIWEDDLKSIPSADIEPVRHGHWEFPIFADSDDELDPRVRCSECGGIEAAFARWNYCPNCGARMDKEDKHGA